ncbi:MAG: hypothetical protein NT053_07370, partial [Cyanobacteria bacterium]|nr:hypothetical protein [Cyanobacteriota bacterium]
AYMVRMRDSGRGRLPVCVVRMRGMGGCIAHQEVEQEAARLDRQANPATTVAAPEGSTASSSRAWGGFYGGAGPFRESAQDDPQEAIDALRAQVAQLACRLDGGSARGAAAASASSNQGPGPKA